VNSLADAATRPESYMEMQMELEMSIDRDFNLARRHMALMRHNVCGSRPFFNRPKAITSTSCLIRPSRALLSTDALQTFSSALTKSMVRPVVDGTCTRTAGPSIRETMSARNRAGCAALLVDKFSMVHPEGVGPVRPALAANVRAQSWSWNRVQPYWLLVRLISPHYADHII